MLEQGKTEKTIIEQCIRNKMPLPKKIENAPALDIGLELFYIGFMDLTTCRSVGFGEGPIPWTAKLAYANELELEGDQRDDLFYYIGELDTTYMEHRAAVAEAKAKEGK